MIINFWIVLSLNLILKIIKVIYANKKEIFQWMLKINSNKI